MALILLRHSAPDIATGICYGRSDVPARLPNGEQVLKLVKALPRAIARIDTSPLLRCHALAEQMAAYFDLPVRTDPRLLEIDFGSWEMQAWDDIPRHEIDAWAEDVEGARPHGGESVVQMAERVRAYLLDSVRIDGHILAVTHLGVVRCIAAVIGRPNPFELGLGFGQFFTVEPGEVV